MLPPVKPLLTHANRCTGAPPAATSRRSLATLAPEPWLSELSELSDQLSELSETVGNCRKLSETVGLLSGTVGLLSGDYTFVRCWVLSGNCRATVGLLSELSGYCRAAVGLLSG